LAELAEAAGCDVESMEVVPDDFSLIEDRLHHYVDDEFTFLFTTGGTASPSTT
jgi:molybdopterin biosynthesis enzyme MoaB